MTYQGLRFMAFFAWIVVVASAQDPVSDARRLNNDAAALYAQGKYNSAERLYRAALALKPDDAITVATVASNLGALYKRQDRYAEAEQMYKQALELRRKWLSPTRPEVADSMNNLAEIYRLQGRYWEARNLMVAAARALEQSDPRSPDMAVFLNNWAGLERDLHNLDRAEQLFRQAWSLAENSGGPQSNSFAIVLNNLAQVLADKQDFENAEQLYYRALGIFESSAPDSTHNKAVTLANAGRVLGLLGRNDDAVQTEFRALALLNREPYPDDLLRAAILHNLGNLVAADGKPAASLAYFDQSLTIREKILGREHPSIGGVLLDYAAAAGRAGEKSQAQKLRKRGERQLARRRRDDLSRYTVDASAFLHLR